MTSDKDLPIQFPCDFPIKVMGRKDSQLESLIIPIFQKHVPDFINDNITTSESSKGKYISITVTIVATSQEQLDNIYRELTKLKEVLMVL